MSPQLAVSTAVVLICCIALAITIGYALGFAAGHRQATKKRPLVVYTTACEAPLRVSVQ